MLDIKDVFKLLEEQGTQFKSWKDNQEAEQSELRETVKELAMKAGRPNLGVSGGHAGEVKHLLTADGRKLPFLRSEQKFADLYQGEKGQFNLGEFCRDNVVGSTKAVSSSALVPMAVGSQVIDAVRAQTVVNAAGAGTIAIDGPSTLARLTTSPAVYQHTEATVDITESDVVAVPVTLNPKLLAVLVPLSVELVQDSPNLDTALSMALAGAFAAKLDALCIATLLADTGIAKSAAAQDPAIWAKLLEAVGAALGLNQRIPSAHISAPADFIARAGQLASTSGTWLGKPPALAAMSELQTTGMSAGTALFGDFAAAFAIAMRSDLRVEVVRHAKPTSGSHLLVAHMRADGVVLQPGHLFKQLKTVV
ncbi:phage major capsid protein [Polaromonas sp. SM01]|uniref:phage major capsid protein n=1 Tax=Polaromonas sp. SM01 TaxID=3085630 RepID=UPI002982B77D|nr:phage major capsid protein [Polaromonas sp. SM01]MDW5441981.1 phage major capsid protein [Polaromonas sp. SM01]